MSDVVGVERLYAELFEAASAGRRLGEEIAARAGQTQARWQTLWTIDSGPFTVPQIARRLGVSRQHILRLTAELVQEGLVALVANPDHKTSPLVTLTPEGETTLAEINSAAKESNQIMLRELTSRDLDLLRDLLQRFTRIAKDTSVGEDDSSRVASTPT